jgi:hypothetical protein
MAAHFLSHQVGKQAAVSAQGRVDKAGANTAAVPTCMQALQLSLSAMHTPMQGTVSVQERLVNA